MILALLIAMLERCVPFSLPAQFGQQTFLATAFYMSGYLCKKQEKLVFKSNFIGVGLLFIPAVAAIFVNWSMYEVKGASILLYYLIAIVGTLGVINLSQHLSEHRFANILTYIGNKTLYILTFHLLAFKLVSFIYIRQCGRPINSLAQFSTIKESSDWLWLVYSIVGVVFSLLIWETFHRVQQLLRIYNKEYQS